MQLHHIHIGPGTMLREIPALTGNIVNNHLITKISTWEIIFYKWTHLLECQYPASVHLANYLRALLSPSGLYKEEPSNWPNKIYSGAEIKDSNTHCGTNVMLAL